MSATTLSSLSPAPAQALRRPVFRLRVRVGSQVRSRFLPPILAAALYFVAVWPAHAVAWWHPDDGWTFGKSARELTDHCVSIGRPLQAVWYLTFLTEAGPHAESWNHAWRIVQGLMHVAAALIAGRAVYRAFPHPAAPLCLLPFLVWPFAAEATVWRAAAGYPIAALLGFRAASILLPRDRATHPARRLAGAFLMCFVAMLASQAAAFSAAALWMLIIAIDCLRRLRLPIRWIILSGGSIAAGLALGAGVSILCGTIWSHTRMAIQRDPMEILVFGTQLARQVALGSGGYYPDVLRWMHLAILALAAAAALGQSARLARRRKAWFLLPLIALTVMALLPFAGPMLAAERWPAWRIMYLGPLLLGGGWLLALQAFRRNRPIVIALVALMAGLVVYDVDISRRECGAWAAVYRHDREQLRQFERFAHDRQLTRVAVLTAPDWRLNANPYGLPLAFNESRISVFQLKWTWAAYFSRYSWLLPAEDDPTREVAKEICRPCRQKDGFQLHEIPDRGLLVICPP